MHELSIAMGIVDGASEEASTHPGEKVEAVLLRLGRLSGVVKEALLFSYDLATEGTVLEGSVLKIDEVPVVIYCQACQAEFDLNSIQNFACPVCSLPSPDIVRGRELLIVGLELRGDNAAAAS